MDHRIAEKIMLASFTTKVYQVRTNDPIIDKACSVLTSYAGNLAKEEILLYAFYIVEPLGSADSFRQFEVYHKDHQAKKRLVSISGEGGNMKANCSCRKPIWHGIVCRHIFAVLRRLNILDCPVTWFNERWLKECEKKSSRIFQLIERAAVTNIPISKDTESKEQELRMAELSTTYKYLLTRSLDDKKSYELTKNALQSAELAVRALHECSGDVGDKGKVNNPLKTKNKGREKKRNQSFLEKKKGKGTVQAPATKKGKKK